MDFPLMRAVRRGGPLAWAGLIACSSMPSDVLPTSAEVRVINPIAWPAGELRIVSPAMVGHSALPVVRLDTQSLAVTRLDDSTVGAGLPDTSGDFVVTVELRGGRRSGTVHLVGFLARTDAAPLTGWPVPDAPGSPLVTAAAESTLVRLDVRSATTTDLGIGHSGTCAISPGPSYRDSVVVAQGLSGVSCQVPKVWTVEPGPVVTDTFPYAAPADRLWADLAPDVLLRTAHHDMTIYHAGLVALNEPLEEGERVVLSPDRTRAVMTSSIAQNQVPVLLTGTGAVAFRLPLASTEAVAFSPGSDTIFTAGVRAFTLGEPLRLLAISTATGAVLVETDHALPQIWDLVVDPDASVIYGVALTDTGGTTWRPIIHVFDRRTLEALGEVRPPESVACYYSLCGQMSLALDPATRTLYAYDIEGWGSSFGTHPTGIWAFALVPAAQSAEMLSP
jgi:hypothetical protein